GTDGAGPFPYTTLFRSYMQEHEGLMIGILLAMALTKAGMVALYFMHLKYDNIVLSIIAGVPLLLVAIAVSVLAYEYANYTPADPDRKSTRLNSSHLGIS